ncbi:anti-sigma factor antagonist [Dactylosporangium darangshiense]|uniref:Anti-sigma factor antagonist n=1 Tax=Dactylosporangium darangshiense TaxID=579108 RepID=A0ABP8DQW5_9ACTN
MLTLSGEIDYETAQELRTSVSSVLDGSIDLLVIDLAGVTFLDSTGIGTLVVAKRICHSMGVKLDIRRPNPFIARLFAVVGVSDILGVPIPPGTVSGRLPAPRERGVTQPA